MKIFLLKQPQDTCAKPYSNLSELEMSLRNISPLPNLKQSESSINKKMHSKILTSTPFEVVLEKEKEMREARLKKKAQRQSEEQKF